MDGNRVEKSNKSVIQTSDARTQHVGAYSWIHQVTSYLQESRLIVEAKFASVLCAQQNSMNITHLTWIDKQKHIFLWAVIKNLSMTNCLGIINTFHGNCQVEH